MKTNKEPASNRGAAGLCGSCIHARHVETERKSIFYLCLKSLEDASFPKYPCLPVTECCGYQSVTDTSPGGNADK